MTRAIEMTETEQKLAIYISKQRKKQNESEGLTDRMHVEENKEKASGNGIAAEIAFCKLFNVYPDLQTKVRERADAHTMVMGGVDVKHTRLRNGRLLGWVGKLNKKTDSYALMVGDFPRYFFIGWATADELFAEENIRDLGHGPTYCLDQDQLRKI